MTKHTIRNIEMLLSHSNMEPTLICFSINKRVFWMFESRKIDQILVKNHVLIFFLDFFYLNVYVVLIFSLVFLDL